MANTWCIACLGVVAAIANACSAAPDIVATDELSNRISLAPVTDGGADAMALEPSDGGGRRDGP